MKHYKIFYFTPTCNDWPPKEEIQCAYTAEIQPLRNSFSPAESLKSAVSLVNELSRNFFFVTRFPLQMVLIYFQENLTFTVLRVPFNSCSPWFSCPSFNLQFHIEMALSTHTTGV